MKRLTLPAVFLSLIFAIPAHAQSLQSVALKQVDPPVQPGPSPQPAMTPLQVAEMRADILMARKMYPDAIKAYMDLVKQQPKDTGLLNKLGEAYLPVNTGRAERWFKQAIKTDKDYASAYNNVGTVEYDKRHYKDAIKWYEKALLLHPDGSVAAPTYSNLGYAYFAWKKYPEAMSAFQQALRIDPQILTESGDSGSVLKMTGTTDPGLFYFYLARTYAQLGNVGRAAHYLKMSRDVGYKKLGDAKTDPAFANVIKDPRVQAVFRPVPVLVNSKQP